MHYDGRSVPEYMDEKRHVFQHDGGAVMTALLISLVSNPTVLAILAGIAAALGWGWKQRRDGAAKERAKQAEAERKARTIADEVENDIGAMPPAEARKELSKWSKS